MADNYTYEAKYYDIQQKKYMDWVLPSKIDFVLWASDKYLGERPKEILELACGTGFHGVAFALKGIKIHGVDIAPNMIEVYRKKINELRLTDKITLTEGDMVNFSLEKRFNVAVSLFNELYELKGKENVQKAMKNILKHLNKGGIFIAFLEDFTKRESLKDGSATWTGFHEEDGVRIQRTITEDIEDGVMHWESFSIVDDNGKMSTIYTSSDFRLWGYEGFKNFLEKAGFSKVDCYSNLKKRTRFKRGDRFMIFVAQK